MGSHYHTEEKLDKQTTVFLMTESAPLQQRAKVEGKCETFYFQRAQGFQDSSDNDSLNLNIPNEAKCK